MREHVPGFTSEWLTKQSSLMECSVCYSETSNCHLTCGHSFCFGCVKEWYHKCTEPTCPMCRKSLNFKGLRRLEEKWSEEAREQKIDELFGEYLDDMLEECLWSDFVMMELEDTQKRLQMISDWEFDRDLFEGVMYDAIDIINQAPPREYDEPKTFEHTLFAGNTPTHKQTGMATRRYREPSTAAAILEIMLLI